MVHASAPLLGQGVHGLEHVGGLERPADQGEDSQPVEGEGLLEPLIETGRRGLVHPFATDPPLGHEYVLSKFRVEVLDQLEPRPHNMITLDWESRSGSGSTYPRPFAPLDDALTLEREGLEGASWEGWVAHFVATSDPNAVSVYQSGRAGEAWFRMR